MLQKILFKPGVNRENTRYTTEGGWYDCDKIRFRQGTPEKIGGWQRISTATFLGVCRSLWNWVTLAGNNLLGIGTNKKFYIEQGGSYKDITPIRSMATLTNPFTAVNNSPTITVADTAHGCLTGDYVIFTGATGLGGNITAAVLNQQYEVTVIDANTYTFTATATANTTDASGSPGGGTVYAAYQLNTGPAYVQPLTGWGAGTWGSGPWGMGVAQGSGIQLWSQMNYGQDLVFGPRGGGMYYWSANQTVTGLSLTVTIASPAVFTLGGSLPDGTAIQIQTTGALPTGLLPYTTYYVKNSSGVTCNLSATYGGASINTSGTQSGTHRVSARGVNVNQLAGASAVPTVQNYILVSDASRFTIAFGCNDYGETTQDPMLIRWSDQENITEWTPAVTNQAGSVRLSHGSEIVTAMQVRQEIIVWTDSSLYSLQYLGPPYVWGNQLLGDNISIVSENSTALASGVAYWMGIDKFYKYDGRIQTLRCDLRQYIFNDINQFQYDQIFAGTNEGFNEVWWFYCSSNSNSIDKYVVYNYSEDTWYYGTMARTAWLDTSIREYPVAATYSNNIVNHENGLNDNETGTAAPIESYITSSEFDIGDGHNFGFVWRLIPDVTFRGSTTAAPSCTMTLLPLQNSGSGYNNPQSEGGVNYAAVTRSATVPIEQFTGQVYVRVRGRQMSFKMYQSQLDATWQLGAPRIDIKQDGRRGNT
jgi:hypothetical protein